MNKVKVFDHGYLGFVEHWGSDERIIEAARMSTDKGFRQWAPYHECPTCPDIWRACEVAVDVPTFMPTSPSCRRCGREMVLKKNGDQGLLEYLERSRHGGPFEFAGMVIEVQAPIMVFREWHRHRTQSYNEMSGRYTPLPDLNHIPSVERLMRNSKTNRQAGTASGTDGLTEAKAREYQICLESAYSSDQNLYEWALRTGVPKELARVHLPVGRYSRMRASANLRNWLAFLTLRMDMRAQEEIREYASEVGRLIAEKFPRTWELFAGGRP